MDIEFGTFGSMTSSQNQNTPRTNFVNESQERSIQIGTFFENLLNLNLEEMVFDQPVDVKGYEIRSWNLSTNKEEWCQIKRAVRKQDVVPWIVYLEDGGQLSVSPEHRFWAKTEGGNPRWVEAETLGLSDAVFELFGRDGWVTATFVRGKQPIKILDIEVDETHAYFSNGVLSHNTMYGDPMTTSGGLALPFHASVRISLTGGKKLENHVSKEIYGIEVHAFIIKNKVGKPFRKMTFEIHFGKGIHESEQLFDCLREWCEKNKCIKNGKSISIQGTSAWKDFLVIDEKTGQILHNKKFYKNDFRKDILEVEEYKPFINDLIESALVRENAKNDDVQIDQNGYETPGGM